LQNEIAKAAATDYYARKIKESISIGDNPGLESNQLENKHM
jgi:hypothetical protein